MHMSSTQATVHSAEACRYLFHSQPPTGSGCCRRRLGSTLQMQAVRCGFTKHSALAMMPAFTVPHNCPLFPDSVYSKTPQRVIITSLRFVSHSLLNPLQSSFGPHQRASRCRFLATDPSVNRQAARPPPPLVSSCLGDCSSQCPLLDVCPFSNF